ncbi:MAG TPA: DUF1588 domain-containing protein [Polyangiaceae bacterium]|nr:DUF1588 domain-containing protein [Polyangiaceae bacterium]
MNSDEARTCVRRRLLLSESCVALGASLVIACNATISGAPSPGEGSGAQAATSGGMGPHGAGSTSTMSAGGMGAAPASGGSTGTSGGTTGTTSGGTNAMPDPDSEGHLPYAAPVAAAEALPARTWKLSHEQYAKSVQALVGKAVDVSDLEPEIDNGVYPNMSGSGLVRVALAGDYYDKAKALTDALTTQELTTLAGGQLVAGSKAAFLAGIVERAFRRPAAQDELDAYGAIFDLGASGGDAALGFRSVLRALLTSPNFLYRTEIGTDAAAKDFQLTSYEVASLLSYSLLDTPPTADLLGAAKRGELTSPSTLATAVTSLLTTPEATAELQTFALEWLKIYKYETKLSADEPPYPQKDTTRFPGYDNVRQAMFDESTAFLKTQAGPTGTLSALLTTPLPMPTGALGNFYTSDATGSAGGTRTGVLALGTVLSLRAKETSTSPTQRGLFVRDRFLCQEIHLPDIAPPDISETQARIMPKTTRELYEQHAAQASCRSCHSLLDSVGFNFEDLDAAGRFRTQENGVAIDTSGDLLNTDVDGPMANHTELARALAKSEWVRECVARQAFRFYFGEVEADRGIPPVQAARAAIASGSFRDAAQAVMTTPSTYHRVRP